MALNSKKCEYVSKSFMSPNHSTENGLFPNDNVPNCTWDFELCKSPIVTPFSSNVAPSYKLIEHPCIWSFNSASFAPNLKSNACEGIVTLLNHVNVFVVDKST